MNVKRLLSIILVIGLINIQPMELLKADDFSVAEKVELYKMFEARDVMNKVYKVYVPYDDCWVFIDNDGEAEVSAQGRLYWPDGTQVPRKYLDPDAFMAKKGFNYIIMDVKGGTNSFMFSLMPAKVGIVTLKRKGKNIIVKLKKSIKSYSTGYKIEYRTKKEKKKTIITTKNKVKIKNISKKKKYYIRARAFIKYNGKTIYSYGKRWVKIK